VILVILANTVKQKSTTALPTHVYMESVQKETFWTTSVMHYQEVFRLYHHGLALPQVTSPEMVYQVFALPQATSPVMVYQILVLQ